MTEPSADNPPVLDHAEIDADHRGFAELVGRMSKLDDAQFAAEMGRLVDRTKAHFERENALMDHSGFPATEEHQGEHRRVLSDLEGFLTRAQRGLVPFARAYVFESLVPWFGLHIRTMDSALVAHLQRDGS